MKRIPETSHQRIAETYWTLGKWVLIVFDVGDLSDVMLYSVHDETICRPDDKISRHTSTT